MNNPKSQSKEPEQLKRGKVFQEIVQTDYSKGRTDKSVGIEEGVKFEGLPKIKQKRGRMDIFIRDSGDGYVMIIEIKATNWDKIKPKNIKRNLYRHSKQLYNYIDKFLEIDDKTVGLAVIYPEPPKTKGLREFIENCAMEQYCFPVYWYSELKTLDNL